MTDQELEKLLHDLKPAPLPNDLRNRLAAEPKQSGHSRKTQVLLLVSGLAAVVVVFLGMMIFWWPDPPAPSDGLATGPAEPASPAPGPAAASNERVPAPDRPVSVIKKDSTLLDSRLIAIKEYEGELWEISEEEWRDDTLVLFSAGPSKLNSTVIRREVVCSPLQFQ